MKPITKYKGAIKLSAIGDALGWMTEFVNNSDILNEKFGTTHVNRFFDWNKNVGGRFYGFKDKIKAGSYSDDTQLMLAVARSIMPGGLVDNSYFGKTELANWIYYARGGGRTVKNAAKKINRKNVSWYNNFYNYKIKNSTIDYRDMGANGAAMRVLPIALANLGNQNTILSEAIKNSIVTHGHPRAIIGSMLYTFAIDKIIVCRAESFEPLSFITSLGKNIEAFFDLSNFLDNELNIWINTWNKGSNKKFEEEYNSIIQETKDYLRVVYKCLSSNRRVEECVKSLGCYSNDTKGSGTSTVICGIYLASKYSSTPIEGIEKAVNLLGTDTDSIAAFTGGLLGALHGSSIIPERWKNVQDSIYLDKISEDLLSISESSLSERKAILANENLILINSLDKDSLQVGQSVFFNPLGTGKITSIERQDTIAKVKFNFILCINFSTGQSCKFAILLDKVDEQKSNDFEKYYKNWKKYVSKEILLELKKMQKVISKDAKILEIINKIIIDKSKKSVNSVAHNHAINLTKNADDDF